VRAVEIWNEPNHAWFWPSGPDPARYAEMLKAAYGAAKAADPASTVLLTGISPGLNEEGRQSVRLIRAESSDTLLMADPTVVYHGDGTATLTFAPKQDAFGEAEITVTASDPAQAVEALRTVPSSGG
jgi:arabinogalactan endo-1,4-beta-galactosidase